MMPPELATPGHFRLMLFWNKGSDVIIFIRNATNKILSSSSNNIVDVVMGPNLGYSSIFMREVTIAQMLYGFFHKTDSEGWSWFRFNNLRLVLGMALKFYSIVGLFALFPPPILNRVKNELTDSCPLKTSKKEKCRFHSFTVCSVKVTSIVSVIIPENMFGNFKISCFYLQVNRGGEVALLSFRLQMLNIMLRKI